MLSRSSLRAATLLVIFATYIGLTPTTSYSNPPQFQSSLRAHTTMNSIGRRIRNIAVDTDVGFDDLFALTMLLGSQDVNIRIITTVQGMTKPDTGADVVRRLLKRFGREDVPVHVGAETPEYGHTIEESGWGRKYAASYQENIDKLGLPTVEYSGVSPTRNTAAQALAEVCRTNPDTTLLCLGPLTNIHAMSQLLEQTGSTNGSPPRPLTYHDMVLMGGAVHCPGNCGPNRESEFNFYSNPRAAHAVFASTSTSSRNARVGSIRLADLDTANDAHEDRVNTFIESLVDRSNVNVNVETNTNTRSNDNDSPALELLPALVSIMPSSSGCDPIATAYFLNPAVMESETVAVTVNDVNGATEPSESVRSDTTILLATKLNVDLYLQTIQDIMVPKPPVEE